MAKSSIATGTPDVADKLRNAVEFIDSMSQGGFAEIATIAKLALSRLETPDGYSHLDEIACALEAIWGKAEATQNLINGEAEAVGCNFINDAQRRRWAALHEARATGKL